MIMGRKTHESIGRPLPNRENIVVTRQRELKIPGCIVVHSLAEALTLAEEHGATEACVIGGGELFGEALPLADRVYLTRVHAVIEGDTFFPTLDPEEWQEVSSDERSEDAKHLHSYTFMVFERRKK